MKLINIKKELNISLVKDFKEKLDPDYIYLPIEIPKQDVFKGEIIGNHIISVSGHVINKNIVENNFMEEIKPIDDPVQIIKKLFPEFSFLMGKDIIYINCIDKDPYCYNRYYILKNNKELVIEALEKVLDKFKIKLAFLVLTSSQEDIINDIKEFITYNNIKFKVMDDLYPIGFSDVLKLKLNVSGNMSIIEVEDLLDVYSLIKKKIINTEKYITINGNNVPKPLVLKVKLYSRLSDYLKYYHLENNSNIVLNNSLCGKIVSKDIIITRNTDLFIINKTNKIIEEKCINCGLCYRVCPIGINPLKKNNKCIKCGLCNYVCPSKINCLKVGGNNV